MSPDDVHVNVDTQVVEVMKSEVEVSIDETVDVIILAAGNVGPAGAAGVDGTDGTDGVDGVDGAPGPPGAPGSDVTNTIIDAKGDLLVGSAPDVLVRLPVGSAGQYLTPDASTTPGLKWAAVPGGALVLDGLTDVTAPSPADENVLTWDAGASAWVNKAGVLATKYLAKGDIFAASGASAFGRLPVGAPGQLLQPDASATLGLKWDALPPPTPGTSVMTGFGVPSSSLGTVYDLYVDSSTGIVYRKDTIGSTGITYRSQNGVQTGGASTSVSVPMPAGYAAGDILIMMGSTYNTGPIPSTPSGWTSIGAYADSLFGRVGFLFWKIATGAEGSSVTVSAGASTYWAIGILAYSGGNNVDVSAYYGSTQTGSYTFYFPALTTTISNDMLIGLISTFDSGSTTPGVPPSGWTNRLLVHNTSTNHRVESIEKVATAAGLQNMGSIVEVADSAAITFSMALKGTAASTAWVPIGSINYVDKKVIQLKIFDDSTVVTTGDGKLIVLVDATLNGKHLVDAVAFVTTVSSSGLPTVQISNLQTGLDLLSTKVTIDAGEISSYTAATQRVIDTSSSRDIVTTNNRLSIDVDVAGTGAKGLGVILTFQ